MGYLFALIGLLASLPLVAEELRGVTVESIGGWALEDAGIQARDVLLSWRRLPNPPTNPDGAEGELISSFDWSELEIEQAPRGIVELRGLRDASSIIFTVEPGLWASVVRPVLPQPLEDAYLAGKQHLNSGRIEAAVSVWGELKDSVKTKASGDLQAWIALLIGKAWADQGNWQAALESTQNGLVNAESSIARVAASLALGRVREGRNEFNLAQVSYAGALEIRRMLDPDSLGVASCLNSLGLLDWHRGKLDQAHEFFSRALSIQEGLAPNGLGVAESLSNLGVVLALQGNLEHAANYLSEALQIQGRLAPQSLVMAETLGNLGYVAQNRRDLKGARDYTLRALQIEEVLAPRSLNVAGSLNNLGALALEEGDLENANRYLLQALQIEEKLVPGSLSVATCLNNLGGLAWIRGDLDRAYDFHSRSVKIREKIAPESLQVASSLNNLGSVAWTRREFRRANDYHLDALRIQKKISPKSLDLAATYGNLGLVARAQGDLERAQDYHLQALQIAERIAPQSFEVAITLNNLGAVEWARRDLERAYEYHNRSSRIREHLAPQSIEVAISLNHLSFIAYARGDLKVAERHTVEAIRIIEQIAPERYEMAQSLNHLGDIARSRGDLDSAYQYYSKSLAVFEHQVSKIGGSYDVQVGFRAQHKEYFDDAMSLLQTQGRHREAFDLLESYRAQTFLAMLAERDIIFSADVPEELDRERRLVAVRLDRALKGLSRRNLGDLAIKSARHKLDMLLHEAGDIEARIRQASPRLAALQYPRPLDTAKARETLDPDVLQLSYSVSEEQSTVFALSQTENLRVEVLPVGREELRSRVERLRSLILEAKPGSSLGDGRTQLLKAESRALYDLLLGPMAEQIVSSERLLILPDGPLHDLPFAALIRSGADDEGDNQYLVEWKPVHVALSATVFAELKQERRVKDGGEAPAVPIKIAAFGDPIYPASLTAGTFDAPALLAATDDADSPESTLIADEAFAGDPTVRSAAERGIFDWPPLPYTRREVEGIASLFPEGSVRTFLGAEALEERIKSLDRDTQILHIAAHGHTDEHLPSSSFIALTIPEDVFRDDTETERDNGLLQVWEIFERVRMDADLVVLSACESGLGQELGTEGLIGLTRAFQYAGARSVVASLWSVADQTTAELMIRFYRHLRDGLPKDEALRAAQIELIRGPIEVTDADGRKVRIDASAPYYWAAFQIFGDWQ
jgi:CHAT domain-containing protein/Tfp pilus assembly protein PilF